MAFFRNRAKLKFVEPWEADMPSDLLTRALRSKSTLTDSEIAALTPAEGWSLLYEIARAAKESRDQICFTGFGKVECDELKRMASDTGWLKVVGSVTNRLSFLCTGENPGPAKVDKASKIGATFLDKEAFEVMIADGSIPRSVEDSR